MDFPFMSIVFMLLLAVGMFYGQSQYKRYRKEWGKSLTIVSGFSIIILAMYVNVFRPFQGPDLTNHHAYQRAKAVILSNHLVNKHQGNSNCLIIHEGMQSKEELERLKENFQLGFGDSINIRMVPIREIPENSDEEFYEEAMMEPSAEDFNKVIEANKDCDMVIIMATLPHSEDELYAMGIFNMIEDEENPGKWVKDPDGHYPLLGIHNGYIGNLRQFFEEGLIEAMTMWKPDPEIDEEKCPEDYRKAFDKRYMMMTGDNLDDLKTAYPKLFAQRKK